MKRTTFILLLVVAAAAMYVLATPVNPGNSKRCTVKLYSGASVVATWDAVGYGTVQGETLEFIVGSDLSPRKVRISGTWSIEERD